MTSYSVNPLLLDLAAWQLQHEQEKRAFVPSDVVASQMPPPGDPAAQGMPPGGMGDPAMAAGMAPPMSGAPMGGPPMDPAMMGGPPPSSDPLAQLAPMVQQMVQQALQQAGVQGGAAGATGATGGAAGAGGAGAKKIDPALIYLELGRLRKLLTTMFQNNGWPLPSDILDDQAVAASVSGQLPATQAIGMEAPPAMGMPMQTPPPAEMPKQAKDLLQTVLNYQEADPAQAMQRRAEALALLSQVRGS